MESLIELKKKYNALLDRNSKAEAYLNTHNFYECHTPIKNKDGTFKIRYENGKEMWVDAFSLFNELVADLSKTKKEIEVLLYRNMTVDEIWNGFKV
jgi:hypothetical protein